MKFDTATMQEEICRISHSQDVQFNAPISLVSKPSDESKETSTIKLMLCNDPEAKNQGEYEKKVTTFMACPCNCTAIFDRCMMNLKG